METKMEEKKTGGRFRYGEIVIVYEDSRFSNPRRAYFIGYSCVGHVKVSYIDGGLDVVKRDRVEKNGE